MKKSNLKFCNGTATEDTHQIPKNQTDIYRRVFNCILQVFSLSFDLFWYWQESSHRVLSTLSVVNSVTRSKKLFQWLFDWKILFSDFILKYIFSLTLQTNTRLTDFFLLKMRTNSFLHENCFLAKKKRYWVQKFHQHSFNFLKVSKSLLIIVLQIVHK